MGFFKRLFCNHNYRKIMYSDFMGNKKCVCLKCYKVHTYNPILNELPLFYHQKEYDYSNKKINQILTK